MGIVTKGFGYVSYGSKIGSFIVKWSAFVVLKPLTKPIFEIDR